LSHDRRRDTRISSDYMTTPMAGVAAAYPRSSRTRRVGWAKGSCVKTSATTGPTANRVLDGTDAVLVRTDEMLFDVVRKGQSVLNIVPLAHVLEELDAGVREDIAEPRLFED
jgi:hypothetical protein